MRFRHESMPTAGNPRHGRRCATASSATCSSPSSVSNLGTWMQNVAAQWFSVEMHSTAVIVALVQTASLGSTLILALFAGVLADLFDRRRLLIVLQWYAVVVTLALAVLTYLGRLTPASLLLFTVAIGLASALTAPAWQAIQPEVVSRDQIPAAATLASVSVNISRVIGPAIGGVVVALTGPAAVFAINAISFTGIIIALAAWQRPRHISPIEREHLGQAHHHRPELRGQRPDLPPDFVAGSAFRVSCLGPAGAAAGGRRPQMAPRWLVSNG